MWPYTEIKRRRGSAKPHFPPTMAAIVPTATKLIVGFPKAVTLFQPPELDAVVRMPENGPLIEGGLLFLSVRA